MRCGNCLARTVVLLVTILLASNATVHAESINDAFQNQREDSSKHRTSRVRQHNRRAMRVQPPMRQSSPPPPRTNKHYQNKRHYPKTKKAIPMTKKYQYADMKKMTLPQTGMVWSRFTDHHANVFMKKKYMASTRWIDMYKGVKGGSMKKNTMTFYDKTSKGWHKMTNKGSGGAITKGGKGLWNRKGKGLSNDSCAAEVTKFMVTDRIRGDRLFSISPGEVIDLNFIREVFGVMDFAVECVFDGGMPQSALLVDSFGNTNIDNTRPYATPVVLGDNELTCQAFCGPNATGKSGPRKRVAFSIVLGETPTSAPVMQQTTLQPTSAPIMQQTTLQPTIMAAGPVSSMPTSAPTSTPPTVSPTTDAPTRPQPTQFPTMNPTETSAPTPECPVCAPGCVDVVAFNLFDTQLEEPVRQLRQRDTVVVTENDFLTIECVADPPFMGSTFEGNQVRSMVLFDNVERQEGTIENFPPFILSGAETPEQDSNFFENPGEWIVSCVPYCRRNGNGEPAGPTRTITFNVVRG